MDDQQILDQIKTMVAAEQELRTEGSDGAEADGERRARLAALEVQLDQCWDLLRQRRAHREFDQNPDASAARSGEQVEHYLQ
jgi:hypothetical protein